ncbi:MAG: hypothetical protein IJ565_05895 [Bacilli bacterium]|nr:hypothetical protein [Bacilli bacterium]
MIDRRNFLEQEEAVENIFYDFMKEKGYTVYFHRDEEIKYMGYGGNAVKEDKFAVFFTLSADIYPRHFSIFAEDRNGNFVLTGEAAAIYSLSATPDSDINKLKNTFKILLNDIYEKYKDYSKENRLDFVYNELETDRKHYDINNDTKNIEKEEENEIER